jgi:predicted transcriptional regulator
MTPQDIKQHKKELGWSFSKIAQETGITTRAVQGFAKGEYKPKKSWVLLFEEILKKNKKKC